MCGVASGSIVFGLMWGGRGVVRGSVSDYRIRNVFITRRIRPAENMLHLVSGDFLQLCCLLICRCEQTSIEHEVIHFLITYLMNHA